MKVEHVPVPALRPSEYTASLIQALRERAEWVNGTDVLEIGCGSGVVLATLGELGAATLCGVDIEQEAAAISAALLAKLGYAKNSHVHCGDMWTPFVGQRFGLIAANLPHFPMNNPEISGRLPSWSDGGVDGRRLLDKFLAGLGDHLTPGGRAILAHNAFVDLDRSREMATRAGLQLRVAHTFLVYLPDDKLEHMTESVLQQQEGRAIRRYGPYAFADMHIVEVGAPGTLT
jgi:release factor glutamine methyltransferase